MSASRHVWRWVSAVAVAFVALSVWAVMQAARFLEGPAEAGVPLERLEYDAESGNSWEEAVNTRRLMETRGWRRVMVVSELIGEGVTASTVSRFEREGAIIRLARGLTPREAG